MNGNISDNINQANNQSKSTVVGTDQDGRPQQNDQTQEQQIQATTQNSTQSQSKALPETGKEEVNSGLVTSIAAVLLSVGSLLTFKRFSKANK